MAAAPESVSTYQMSDQQPTSGPSEGSAAGSADLSKIGESATGAESAKQNENKVDGLTVVDTNTHTTATSPDGSNSTSAANLPPPEISKHIPCRYFPMGTCKYGSSCLFSHGVAGVAGSPGVPPSPSVQAQIPPQQTHQNQQQHPQFYPQHMQNGYMMPAEDYSQGMPMYYPVQQDEYAYAQQMGQFSPPQHQHNFYPFPPQFAFYQQPQQFYPQQQIHQQQNSQLAQTQSHQPNPDANHSNSNSAPAQTELSAAEETNSAEQVTTEGNPEQSQATSPTSPGAANLASGASLHTFFQSGPQQNHANGNSAAYAKSNGRVTQPIQRRPGSISGAAPLGQSGYGGKNVRRFPAGSVRPHCSFFEGNRCRNRDSCTFPHLLADGTDARSLQQGWMGADGRTEGPEERGGLPQIWLNNPIHRKHQNHPRNQQFNPQQQQPQFNALHFNPQQQNSRPKNRFENEQIRSAQTNESPAAANGSTESEGTNNLVEAINGLTKQIPAATSKNSTAASGVAANQENGNSATSERQRIPSGDDFPALSSAQISPNESRSASPETTLETKAESKSADESNSDKSVEKTVLVANGNSSGNEEDFVMVQHEDAPREKVENGNKASAETSAPTPAAPSPASTAAPAAAVPAPRISFASAAAKGAAVITPEPIRAKKATIAPSSVNVGNGDAKELNKKKSKASGGKPFEKKSSPAINSPAAQTVQPVAVKV